LNTSIILTCSNLLICRVNTQKRVQQVVPVVVRFLPVQVVVAIPVKIASADVNLGVVIGLEGPVQVPAVVIEEQLVLADEH
jgi:hypothetical protein